MAEFDGLDSRLRDAFAKAAEQGDSAGVADAIRSRVAAGDSGTSVASSTAPGWGGGVGSWLPWIGLIVLAAVGGAALGTSGVLTPTSSSSTETVVYPASLDQSVAGAACPDGPIVGEANAGDRVLAVARSEDSAWLAVRNPADLSRVLWFESGTVVLDEGAADVDTLPVDACPTVVIDAIPPAPGPTEEPAPAPGPSDSTAPSLGDPVAAGNCVITITVTATDNVAVTAATVTLAGANSGSAAMSNVGGGVWEYKISVPPAAEGNTTFTIVARDGAGNSSPAKATSYYLVCLG
jgi:hypothetical protein